MALLQYSGFAVVVNIDFMQIGMQTGNCKQVHIQTTIKAFLLQRLIQV
nr:MAG TPA: hypothetical protein [Caudoviricetes sp.]